MISVIIIASTENLITITSLKPFAVARLTALSCERLISGLVTTTSFDC